MVAHRPRNTDSTRRAFSLEPCRHIHGVAMEISPIGNRVSNVDPDAKSDCLARRLIAVVNGNLLLHPHGAAHRSVNAIEHDKQRVAPCLHDPATMLTDRRVYQVFAQLPETLESSLVIQPDEAAVTRHVHVEHGYELSPIWRRTDEV
jgi:hypothetical protein